MISETTAEASKLLTELGFSLTSDIPAGRVEDNDWVCISYNIELAFKGRSVIKTQYKLGVGHVDIKKARPDAQLTERWSDEEQSMIYAWQRNAGVQFKDKQSQANLAAKLARKQGVKPELADVLHSLILDGEAFFNAQSFEDWAGDFGYDADSRKAEKTYKECDATGRKLAAAVPAEVLAKVRELIADL